MRILSDLFELRNFLNKLYEAIITYTFASVLFLSYKKRFQVLEFGLLGKTINIIKAKNLNKQLNFKFFIYLHFEIGY